MVRRSRTASQDERFFTASALRTSWREKLANETSSVALPLLRSAEKVEIITAREGDSSCQPSQLQGYLAAHGIASETWAFAPQKGSIGEAILEHWRRRAARARRDEPRGK